MDTEPRENRDEGSVSTEFANDGLKEIDGNSFIELYKMVDWYGLALYQNLNCTSISFFPILKQGHPPNA